MWFVEDDDEVDDGGGDCVVGGEEAPDIARELGTLGALAAR